MEWIGTKFEQEGFITTAKHYGDSASNYYQTGGGSVIGDSPEDWNSLIQNLYESGDNWSEMTLVFSIYPLELSDTGNWYIFGSENGTFLIGHWDADGGIWVGVRDGSNNIHTENTTGDGAGDWAGMAPYTWNAIYITIRTTGTQRELVMWSNGVEVYNGTLGTGTAGIAPPSWYGYCWGGRGDGYSGPPERGMESYVSYIWCKEEYLDPNTYWDTFFDENNKPKDIGADGSGVTGSQPDTYAPDGDLSNHVGFADVWDEVGTVPDAPISPTD